jgi:ATP-dependent DNA helicase RecG
VGARTEGFHRVDEPEYPLEALREAVVNAVVHRDYSLSGEAVRLLYYPDRIEVHSPGLLVPGIRLEDLRAGRVPSRPRNPLLVTLLQDMPGNYMERMGSGISYMIQEMAALGRPAPEFVEQQEFVVTFRAAPVGADGAVVSRQAVERGASAAHPTTDMARPGPGSQEERWALALRYVQTHGAITNKGYRQLTGVSDMTALRDLEQLVARGSLRAEGQGRGRKYRP